MTDGSFALRRLEPGSYDVSCAQFWRDGKAQEPPVTLHKIAAGVRDLGILLPRTLKTGVRIFDPDGQPVLGAAVMKASEIYDDGWDFMGASHRDGRFVLRLAESTAARMRFAPLYGSKTGACEPVRDVDGKLDRSFEV